MYLFTDGLTDDIRVLSIDCVHFLVEIMLGVSVIFN